AQVLRMALESDRLPAGRTPESYAHALAPRELVELPSPSAYTVAALGAGLAVGGALAWRLARGRWRGRCLHTRGDDPTRASRPAARSFDLRTGDDDVARAPSRTQLTIDRVDVSAYTVPTDFPESDGTLSWDSTTIVIVEVRAAGVTGLGYTYADTATARLIGEHLVRLVVGRDPMTIPAIWADLRREVRNLGYRGVCAMAISAVDNALWDLKARLLGVPLVTLLGAVRDGVPVY